MESRGEVRLGAVGARLVVTTRELDELARERVAKLRRDADALQAAARDDWGTMVQMLAEQHRDEVPEGAQCWVDRSGPPALYWIMPEAAEAGQEGTGEPPSEPPAGPAEPDPESAPSA